MRKPERRCGRKPAFVGRLTPNPTCLNRSPDIRPIFLQNGHKTLSLPVIANRQIHIKSGVQGKFVQKPAGTIR
jgi:hypothetical protein